MGSVNNKFESTITLKALAKKFNNTYDLNKRLPSMLCLHVAWFHHRGALPVLSNMTFRSSHWSQLSTCDRNSQVTEREDSESKVPLKLYLSNAAKL